ncbi:hypothetical protein DES36_102179 [Alkalibaculum bacchi]|uniref:Uncharacterized protein n=1 Tax=Alkalibaculum bacchi TaxID=645887 RepID=A0A366IDG7_9FIRM|nr:hypothetical protein DES36_102179 [Alkalibaculum bacchi]
MESGMLNFITRTVEYHKYSITYLTFILLSVHCSSLSATLVRYRPKLLPSHPEQSEGSLQTNFTQFQNLKAENRVHKTEKSTSPLASMLLLTTLPPDHLKAFPGSYSASTLRTKQY